MKSRRAVLAIAGGALVAPLLAPAVAHANRRRPRRPKPSPSPSPTPTASPAPNPTPQVAARDLYGNERFAFFPAADAEQYYPQLNALLTMVVLRRRYYLPQASAAVQRPNSQQIESAERHYALWGLALTRYLITVLAAEGNRDARQLDTAAVGFDYAATLEAQRLIDAGAEAAKRLESRGEAYQHRAICFAQAKEYLPQWVAAHQAGTPHTDYAPYAHLFLGGDVESAIYNYRQSSPEEQKLQMVFNFWIEDPVDVEQVLRMSQENKVYLDSLPRASTNPFASTTYSG